MKALYRIKDTKEFKQIVSKRNKLTSSSFIVYYKNKAKDFARIGIATSKKLGKAHIRNHIRRQVRMMAKSIIEAKLNFDLVIVIKPNYLINNYHTNELELLNLVLNSLGGKQ